MALRAAGKSTIVKLLLRFIDIQSGEILIDGQNIAKVTQESFAQELFPWCRRSRFYSTARLMENIRYGKPSKLPTNK